MYLIFNYAEGEENISEKIFISEENPYLENFYKLLKNLTNAKHFSTISLNRNRLYAHYIEDQISYKDYDFLQKMMYANEFTDFKIEPQYENYSKEFYKGIREDLNNFTGIYLIDSNNNKINI